MRFNQRLVELILAISDWLVVGGSLWLAYWWRQKVLVYWYEPIQPWWVYVWLMVGSWLVVWVVAKMKGLYDWRLVFKKNIGEYFWRVWEVGFLLGLLLMSGSYLVKYDFSRVVVVVWWGLVLVLWPIARLWLGKWLRKRFDYYVLVVGKNRMAKRLVQSLKEEIGNQVIKIKTVKRLPYRVKGYDEVVVVEPGLGVDRVLNWFRKHKDEIKELGIGLNFFPKIFNDPRLHLDYDRLPRLSVGKKRWWYDKVKRVMDIVVGLGLLIASLPVMVVVGLVVGVLSRRFPVIGLERIGWQGKPFKMYKFLTMKGKPQAAKSPNTGNDPRIYWWGRFLRRSSLDELPQLFNVVKGDMSLVGPRPEMRMEVDKYKPWQRIRLEVKPGLTGLWQILGRKDLPLNKNLQYDLYYVANVSLGLDLMILFKTPWVVMKGKGAY